MNAVALTLRQVRYEQKSFWRNPTASVFTVLFPVIFLVVFGGNGGRVGQYGISYIDFFVPAMVAYGVMNASYTNLAVVLVARRENGLLKRFRATPLPGWSALGGQVGNCVVTSLLITGVVLAVGVLGEGADLPRHWGALVVSLVAGVLAFASLGAAISTFVPNEDAGLPVVNVVFFLLIFTSDTFFVVGPGSPLARFAGLFPVEHFNAAVRQPFLTRGGSGFAGPDLLVVAIWGVVAAVVAVRRWRWEPRRTR